MNCRTCKENMTHIFDDFGVEYRVVFWCQSCGTLCKIVQKLPEDKDPDTKETWLRPRPRKRKKK